MRRSLSLIAALALLAGCAPGDPGLVILNVVAPDEQCVYDVSNPQRSGGVWDLSLDASYGVALRVGNQLIDLGNSGATGVPRANPNLIDVQELEVEVRDSAGAPLDLGGLPNPYTVPAGGGLIPSGDGTTAGEGLSSADLIPQVYIESLRPFVGSTIVVSFRAIGTTVGGSELVSSEFDYPIQLCSECLFGCATDDEGNALCAPSCTPGQDTIHLTPAQCGETTACFAAGGAG
jgi:hypothetical protein